VLPPRLGLFEKVLGTGAAFTARAAVLIPAGAAAALIVAKAASVEIASAADGSAQEGNYRVVPGHRNHLNDPASEFLITH